MVLTKLLYPGFDDRVEQIAPIPDYIPPMSSSADVEVEDIAEVLHVLLPNNPVGNQDRSEVYSSQQKKLQEFLKGKEPPPAIGTGPIGLVPRLGFESLKAIAYGLPSGIAIRTPEVEVYERSALRSGVGSFSLL
jgi:hypothetical protein